MNEEKKLSPCGAVAPEVARKQKLAWWLMLAGWVLGMVVPYPLLWEHLLAGVAFWTLRKVASNQVVKDICKWLIWVQGVLFALMLVVSLMWIELGVGVIIALDLVVAALWSANVLCYSALARSKSLGEKSLSWLNVIATLLIVRAVSMAFSYINFYEAYSVFNIAWAVILVIAWKNLIGGEAFAGEGAVITEVTTKEAFKVVNRYTVLCFVGIVVSALVILFE